MNPEERRMMSIKKSLFSFGKKIWNCEETRDKVFVIGVFLCLTILILTFSISMFITFKDMRRGYYYFKQDLRKEMFELDRSVDLLYQLSEYNISRIGCLK